MLCENSLPKYFWAEMVDTACFIINRAMIRPILKKTLYELWKGRKTKHWVLSRFWVQMFCSKQWQG